MTAEIVDSFKTYRSLMWHLHSLCTQLRSLLRRASVQSFRETVLNEKISDEEKNSIKKDIDDLNHSIQCLIPEISAHIQRMNGLLKKENEALTESQVYVINRDHVTAMEDYQLCVSKFEDLKKDYKDYDFSEVKFFEVERQKTQLNIMIKKYNNNNLRLMNYKLYDIQEAYALARQEVLKKMVITIYEEKEDIKRPFW